MIVSVAELRATFPADLGSVGKHSDALLADIVLEFEDLAERYRGMAPAPRAVLGEQHRLDQWGSRTVVLDHPAVRSVDSVSVDGEVQVGSWSAGSDGVLSGPSLPCGLVEVDYHHGPDAPPPVARRACMLYVRYEAMAQANPTPGNAYVLSGEGGVIERQWTADWAAGRPTGWRAVDRLLNQLPDHRVPGIA